MGTMRWDVVPTCNMMRKHPLRHGGCGGVSIYRRAAANPNSLSCGIELPYQLYIHPLEPFFQQGASPAKPRHLALNPPMLSVSLRGTRSCVNLLSLHNSGTTTMGWNWSGYPCPLVCLPGSYFLAAVVMCCTVCGCSQPEHFVSAVSAG